MSQFHFESEYRTFLRGTYFTYLSALNTVEKNVVEDVLQPFQSGCLQQTSISPEHFESRGARLASLMSTIPSPFVIISPPLHA